VVMILALKKLEGAVAWLSTPSSKPSGSRLEGAPGGVAPTIPGACARTTATPKTRRVQRRASVSAPPARCSGSRASRLLAQRPRARADHGPGPFFQKAREEIE
jgi:hypothetical protein